MSEIRLSRPALFFWENLARAFTVGVLVTVVWIVYIGWNVR